VTRSRLPLLLLVVALLSACGADDGASRIGVSDALAGPPAGGASQVVVRIANTGDGDDRLVEVTTPVAAGVEFHRTELADGRATMTIEREIALPAGEEVEFRPGGLHLMLVAPNPSLQVGGTFELTLRFEHAGERTVPVEVVPIPELMEGAPAP